MQMLHEMKETAVRIADVRSCAQQHPWLVTGSVVAAGFVVGAVLSHSPRKDVRTTPSHSESNGAPTDHEQAPSRTETASWLSTVGTALTAAVVTVLQGALTAAAVSLFSGDVTADETLPSDGAAPQGELENGTE